MDAHDSRRACSAPSQGQHVAHPFPQCSHAASVVPRAPRQHTPHARQ